MQKYVNLVDLVKSFQMSMYVIATVFCSNFLFSVSPHVPFLNLLFERDSYSNAYLVAKFGFDTAENEPNAAYATQYYAAQVAAATRSSGKNSLP